MNRRTLIKQTMIAIAALVGKTPHVDNVYGGTGYDEEEVFSILSKDVPSWRPIGEHDTYGAFRKVVAGADLKRFELVRLDADGKVYPLNETPN